MSRTLRSNNSEFRKEQIGLNTSVERPAFSNPPLNEAAVMARAPSRQIPTCSQLLPEVDPLQHRVQRRTQRLTPRRETVFHLGRYFRIGLTHDDAVSLPASIARLSARSEYLVRAKRGEKSKNEWLLQDHSRVVGKPELSSPGPF
jgi:hypothetical protein